MARLPDNGIVNWKSSILIPNNGCFSLVGNSDSFDLSWFDATLDKGTSDNRLNRVPDFIWIVFNPTSLRENLSELFLARAYFFSFFIKNNPSLSLDKDGSILRVTTLIHHQFTLTASVAAFTASARNVRQRHSLLKSHIRFRLFISI